MRDRVASQVERIQKTARAVALLDVIASLSFVAERQNYVKPQINERGILDIKNGRHPVVEQMIPNDMFVANDVLLDNGKNRISIITDVYKRQSLPSTQIHWNCWENVIALKQTKVKMDVISRQLISQYNYIRLNTSMELSGMKRNIKFSFVHRRCAWKKCLTLKYPKVPYSLYRHIEGLK